MITEIHTGGTIGSRINEKGVAVPEAAAEGRRPYTILSENLCAEYLNLLLDEVGDVLRDPDTEGIVITHGTDTLQYSAAMLQEVFANAACPIMLVSANYVSGDPRSNGAVNREYAYRFIREKRGCGVFVSYRNPGEDLSVHAGDRLLEHEVFSDRVESLPGQWYGKYSVDEGRYTANPEYRKKESKADGKHPKLSDGSVLWLRPYPGMIYPSLSEETRAVLLGSYHSGTIAVNNGLKNFLREASARKIPVYLCGLSHDATVYETSAAYESLGIVPLYDESPITAYCRLWLRYPV